MNFFICLNFKPLYHSGVFCKGESNNHMPSYHSSCGRTHYFYKGYKIYSITEGTSLLFSYIYSILIFHNSCIFTIFRIRTLYWILSFLKSEAQPFILRAGVPLHNGLLNYFDTADNAFISAYRRHHHNPETIDIVIEYMASPSIEGKTLVLVDPMLATGQSLRTAFEALKPFGTPDSIHLVCVIGSEDGINFIRKAFPKNTHLWIAAVDPILNDHGYIVPGLGDAGDLAFGEKL